MTIPLWMTRTCIAAAILALAACGGSADSATAAPEQPAPEQKSLISTDSASPLRDAIAAARQAAATDPLCSTAIMGDFYWEIGTANSPAPLASGTQGGGTVTASTNFNIASASKFIFGAYVLQKKGYDQVRNDPSLFDGMRFTSGYTGFNRNACLGKWTIGQCYDAGNANNTVLPDPSTAGKFDYDGGHGQKVAAVDLGMYRYTSRQLDWEYRRTLGLSSNIYMAPFDPLIEGGLFASANDYAPFLKRLMNQELELGKHLGDDAVCASSVACPGQVAYSPIDALGEPWKYSYNHWVESQYGNGTIDAYSSPGMWGFYPWITPDRKLYGLISRNDRHPRAYAVSVQCGRQIRKAFLGALRS